MLLHNSTRLKKIAEEVERYVASHINRYSGPLKWIGRRVEVRETKDRIEIQLDARDPWLGTLNPLTPPVVLKLSDRVRENRIFHAKVRLLVRHWSGR
jgi:hypothetical protein